MTSNKKPGQFMTGLFIYVTSPGLLLIGCCVAHFNVQSAAGLPIRRKVNRTPPCSHNPFCSYSPPTVIISSRPFEGSAPYCAFASAFLFRKEGITQYSACSSSQSKQLKQRTQERTCREAVTKGERLLTKKKKVTS
jgi:hypothetical protein